MSNRETETTPRLTRALPLATVLALGLFAVSFAAPGQAGPWLSTGPEGGTIRCLAPDPSHPATVFAGTDRGVFRSDDGGSSWRPSRDGMPLERVATIAIDPGDTSTLYAGTLTPDGVESVGIFKSTDGGASWVAINNGLEDPLTGALPLDVEALAVDPNHPGVVLAGTRFSEIFRSADGGATWNFQTIGGFNVALETSSFLFDPSDQSTVFAATTQGLLVSVDDGANWSPYGDAGVSFFTLVADPSSPTTFYAGNDTGFGILKSTNRGAHWVQINTNLPSDQVNWPFVLAVAVDPSNPSTVYAGTYGNGLFKSLDGGSTWSPAGSQLRSDFLRAVVLDPSAPSTVFVGTVGGGVYRSLDAAATFVPTNAGLKLSLASALVSDPGASGAIYAGTFDGVHKSADGGATWLESSGGLPVAPVAALALRPGASPALLAGTLGGGLFRSSDAGQSWTPAGQGLSNSFISAVAVDPADPSVLYAGTADPSASSERVFKSTDGGATWTQTSLDAKASFIDALAVNPANTSQVAAISQAAASYFQSLDAGATWSSVTPDQSCGGVNAILFHPSGSVIDLGTTAGVCRSTDGGQTWTVHAVASAASVQALTLDPVDPSVLYAGAAPAVAGGTGGVFRSDDGGATWTAVGSGLPGDAMVTAVVFDASGQVLHAAIYGGGVADLSFVPADRLPVPLPLPNNRRTRVLPPR